MTETRERIANRIASSPGIHFNELVRKLDIAPGQAQYHLHRLVDTEDVLKHEIYGRAHYYNDDFDERERTVLALLRRETARDIVYYLIENGESRPGTVAENLGIARSTLEWQLDRLIDHEIVRKDRDQSNRVDLQLVAPEEVAMLLDMIEPTFPERMVDRFTRLLDNMLEE